MRKWRREDAMRLMKVVKIAKVALSKKVKM